MFQWFEQISIWLAMAVTGLGAAVGCMWFVDLLIGKFCRYLKSYQLMIDYALHSTEFKQWLRERASR
jgi:hypothetical protein